MKNFNYLCSTEIVFNNNLTEGLRIVKNVLGAKTAFVVTDPGLVKLPLFGKFEKSLKEVGFEYEVYSDVLLQPHDVNVQDCAEHLIKSTADVVIGFGGGSSIDTAKAAAIVKSNGGHVRDWFGVEKFSIPPMPVIAVPTTAGSGAEISKLIAITDTVNVTKQQINSHMAGPRYAVLCPMVLNGAPKKVISVCGIDALAHGIESYISLKANPISMAFSLKSVEMIYKNLLKLYKDSSDEEAAANMLLGSAISLVAAGYGGAGATDGHTLGRALGGVADVTHGMGVALSLTKALDFYVEAVPELLADCARVMGLPVNNLSDLDAAKQCVLAVQQLTIDLELPQSLKDVGLKRDCIARMVSDTMLQLKQVASQAGSNPRQATAEEYTEIFNKMYDGTLITY